MARSSLHLQPSIDERPHRAIASALASFWRRGRTIERMGYAVGLLLIVSGLVHLIVLAATGATWEGAVSLRKPLTFGVSFGLTLITIVWVASFLRLGTRARTLLLGGFALACTVEVVFVTLQAWRGVPSHYNVQMPFDASVARTLAFGGFAIIAIIGALMFSAFRAQPALPASLRLAIRTGFVLLFSSLVTGALMIAKGMSLVFAGHPDAAYATAGWLKPTHAVTLHAILVLPALAWLLSFAGWSEERRLRVVTLGAAGYVVLTMAVALEDLIGLPRATATASAAAIALPMLSALGVLAFIAAGVLALNGLARSPVTGGIEHD